MTLLETMFLIYAVSIPASYLLCLWVNRTHKEEIEETAFPYNSMFLFKILSFLPIFNTVVILVTLHELFRWYLIDRWRNEEEEYERTGVDDLRP